MSIAQIKQSAKQSNRADVKQEVTDAIVKLLENGGLLEFRKRWAGSALGLPKNIKTGGRYSGINVLLLTIAAIESGYSSPLWMTYKQALEIGANVKKGEKSTLAVFFKKYERENAENPAEKDTIAFANSFRVFNIAQLENVPEKYQPTEAAAADAPAGASVLEDCEKIIQATGADIRFGGTNAYYQIQHDSIHLPKREDFFTTEGFYATAFHELAHWTGAEKRLNRQFGKKFGDDAYAMEELIAELAAAYVCAHTCIKNETFQDNVPYLANWLTVLKADKGAIFTAASAAWKAAEYILKIEVPSEEA